MTRLRELRTSLTPVTSHQRQRAAAVALNPCQPHRRHPHGKTPALQHHTPHNVPNRMPTASMAQSITLYRRPDDNTRSERHLIPSSFHPIPIVTKSWHPFTIGCWHTMGDTFASFQTSSWLTYIAYWKRPPGSLRPFSQASRSKWYARRHHDAWGILTSGLFPSSMGKWVGSANCSDRWDSRSRMRLVYREGNGVELERQAYSELIGAFSTTYTQSQKMGDRQIRSLFTTTCTTS